MILTDIFSMILRLAELVFAGIVAGITGHFLHASRGASSWSLGRFIYTEIIASFSILLALLWLIPFSVSFILWPIDIFLAICWFVAFALIANWLHGSCGSAFNWSGIRFRGVITCGTFRAEEAFAFLSALCWLASALLGIYWVRKQRSQVAAGERGRWYRRSTV